MSRFPFAFILLILTSSCCLAEIYSWVDEQGNRVYSDQNTDGQRKKISTKQAVNYYNAPTIQHHSDSKTAEIETDAIFSSESADSNTSNNNEELSEQDCWNLYRLSCDRVIHWRKYAVKACSSDPRCEDDAFLERKYKPVAVAKLRALAQRNAARRNRQHDDIELFLRQRYTNYCETQEEQICNQKSTIHQAAVCKKIIERGCEQDLDIEALLSQYDDLTPAQKQHFIRKAELYNNQQRAQDLGQLLDNVLDTLITSALPLL
jgi:hypothetical protein